MESTTVAIDDAPLFEDYDNPDTPEDAESSYLYGTSRSQWANRQAQILTRVENDVEEEDDGE